MMDMDYRIIEHQEDLVEYKKIQQGLDEYAAKFEVPLRDYINVFCYKDNMLIGGAVGNIVLPRLNIKWLWVDKEYRGQDIGRTLIDKFEKVAHEKKCDRVFVDTMSYQAPDFYFKVGYREVARIQEFHPGHDRVFYQKDLV